MGFMTALSCGAEDPSSDICLYQHPESVHPQFLPVPPEAPSASSKKRKRFNGCETILHSRAIVSPNNMWRAAEMAFSAYMIPLEDHYFSKAERNLLAFEVLLCGCSRTGIGCAVCGNALGVLATPCALHQESHSAKNYYTILPSAVSPPIPPYIPPRPHPVSPARPLPTLPMSYTRRRHPTSPPPVIIYADFTPTPSPESIPSSLPGPQSPGPQSISMWDLIDATMGEGDSDGDQENVEPRVEARSHGGVGNHTPSHLSLP
ncbi:hypothetical protein B0H19DRAFT_1384874 [Mycena capillaripes]|nr:hypothetical protein B0H19DRAFT_1384874 [Mycena capillaripes]